MFIFLRSEQEKRFLSLLQQQVPSVWAAPLPSHAQTQTQALQTGFSLPAQPALRGRLRAAAAARSPARAPQLSPLPHVTGGFQSRRSAGMSHLAFQPRLRRRGILLELGQQLGGHDLDLVVVPHVGRVHFLLGQDGGDARPVLAPGGLLLRGKRGEKLFKNKKKMKNSAVSRVK